MSKEEDWKELEEWQDKQNEIKQKNNVKEFKAKEYRGTEIFTKLISKLLGSVFSIFVIIFIIAVIVSMFYIKSLFGIYASVNVKKRLKNEYRGQKFVVVNDYGKDIVCAGVSTILTTTVNAILKFNDQAIELSQEKDIVLTVLIEDEVTSKLLENMVELLYELEESYPKNITIRKRDN